MRSFVATSRGMSGSRAFTLVELLVAMSITIVLAGIMISVVAGILASWNRSRGQLFASNQAKLVLDQMVTDLEGAFFKRDDDVWFAATILESNNASASESNAELANDRHWVVSGSQSVSIKPRTDVDARGFVLDAPSIADCRFGMAGVWLRFFTTKQDNNINDERLSAPSAVSYQIVRRNVFGNPTPSNLAEIRYMFYRSEVRPEGTGTFGAGYNLDPDAGDYITPIGTEGDPGNVIRPNGNRVIANNVIDFGVRLYVREGSAFRLIFPAQPSGVGVSPFTGTPSTGSSTSSNPAELSHLATGIPPQSGDFYRERFPDVVEIHLRVLTDEGARLIQNLEADRIEGNWWDIALANSRVFTRRVEIIGRGL